MAFLFGDSFGHYATAQLPLKWSSVGAWWSIAAVGRYSTNGLAKSGGGSTISKAISPGSNVCYFGFAHRNTQATSAYKPICYLWDGLTVQISICIDYGRIAIYRGARAALLEQNPTEWISDNVWYFLECKAVIADAGSWEVRVNGTTVLSGSGDTQASGNSSYDAFGFGDSGGNSRNMNYSDLYVCDDQGSYCNDFLGDVLVKALLPDADGTYTDWAASAGNRWECVNENPPNDDTNYIQSKTDGQKCTFSFGALGLTGDVKATQLVLYGRKDDAGTLLIRPITRTNTTDYAGTDTSVSDSYLYYSEVRQINPNTSNPWAVTEIDNSEFGVELRTTSTSTTTTTTTTT